MNEVRRADYANYQEVSILRYDWKHYCFKLLGFCLAVIAPMVYGIWVLLTSHPIKDAVIMAFYLLPLGFLAFAISFRFKASCRLCGGAVDVFWCREHDERGRRSGPFAVCEHCQAYEARLTSDEFD